MKYFCAVISLGVVLVAALPAWAQYGLYGSPDMLNFESINSTAAGQPTCVPADYQAPETVSAAPDRFTLAPPAPRPAPASKAPHLEPAKPARPSVIDQMLAEPTGTAPDSGYPSTSGCGVDYGCEADDCAGCGSGCYSPWYSRANWLIMGRDQPNTLWTTYEDGNNANQLSTEIGLQWANGGQITIGHRYCCGCWAVEGTYWGLGPMEGHRSVTNPNGVSTPLSFSDVVWANPAIPGLPQDLFDGADEHRLFRTDEFHNIELNAVRDTDCGLSCNSGCNCLNIDWLVGIRYFRFREDWLFQSLRGGGSWTNPDEFGFLQDKIINNLIGFQFGFNVDYCCHQNVRLFARPKFGIYDNYMENTFVGSRGDGELFAPDPNSGVPGSYPVHSTVNGLSFMAELDLGAEYQVTPQWSAFVGYRVVAATGIGLADNQIPPYIVDVPELAAIDRNGDLVLHGAFAGVSYSF